MRTYHCVDMLNPGKSEDIEASSPDIAMKRYFQMLGMSEKPVRSTKQAHAMELDGRFYTKTNHDVRKHNARHTLICFNREGFEFYGCTMKEFPENAGRNLPWNECGNLA